RHQQGREASWVEQFNRGPSQGRDDGFCGVGGRGVRWRSVKKSCRANSRKRQGEKVGQAKTPRPPRARGMRIPGVDFEPHIDRLLKLAGVVNTDDARLSLNISLGMARADWDLDLETRKARIPTEELSTLEISIKRVQILLRNSEKYLDSQRIRFVHCPVGEGTVATRTFEPGKWGETVPFPPDPLPPLGGSPETVPHG